MLRTPAIAAALIAVVVMTALPPDCPGQDVPGPRTLPAPGSASPDPGSGRWGTFRGRVVFKGDAPAPRELFANRDRDFLDGRDPPITSEKLVVDAETKGVANALVYLVRPSAISDSARRAVPKSLRQTADRGMFVPHVVAAMKGTEILVSTDDPIVYNLDIHVPIASAAIPSFVRGEENPLFETRLPPSNKLNAVFGGGFNDGRRTSLKVTPLASNQPVRGMDGAHPWMSTWWFILDHPYFAVTDDRGRFTIHDVPTGTQEVIVWHESVDPNREMGRGKPKNVFQGEVDIRKGRETFKLFAIEQEQIGVE